MSRAAVLLSTAVMALVILVASPAQAATHWVAIGSDHARALDESQGLATIVRPSGTQIRYTGVGTIPADVRARGWDHVGDPDSVRGWYVEPYQRSDGGSKMFRAQAPNGTWSEYVHTLAPGEALNNSWDAISVDGPWMLSGEWGTMDRLLGFATPGLNPRAVAGAELPIAFAVHLDHAVRDVQGCVFYSARTLLCSSDDPAGELFGITKPLLQVDLSGTPDGADLAGHVTALQQLPLSSGCRGSFEVEGLDYNRSDGILRVIVMSPGICVVFDSKTWRFRQG
jgi:hypothetical protein